MKYKLITMKILVLIILFTVSAGAQLLPTDSLITETEIRNDLEQLASPEFEGREAGTTGGIMAGDYILQQLKRFKLTPLLADNDTENGKNWVQEFQIIGAFHRNVHTSLVISRGDSLIKAVPDVDYFYFFNSAEQLNLNSPLIFSGYAITAPEYQYDDLSTVDIQDKIVVAWYGEPLENDSLIFFNSTHQTKYMMEYWKARNVAEKGGEALLLMATPDNIQKYEGFLKRRRAQTERLRFILKEDTAVPVIYLSPEFSKRLFGDMLEEHFMTESKRIRTIVSNYEKISVSWNRPELPELKSELKINYENEEIRNCRNILASVPGTDPEQKKEYVLVGAHYDHEGIKEGEIFPGADDNASGVAADLNVARAYSQLNKDELPARTVIFAFWDGEEEGTLGTRYFVNNPIIKLQQIKAVFNMDMIGRDASFNFAALRQPMVDEDAENKVMLFYSAQAEGMRQLAKKVNSPLNLHLLFDPNVYFTSGSDHVNFHSLGIPVVYYFTGFHMDYTSPGDTPDKINFEKLTRITRHIAAFSYSLSNRKNIPQFDEQVLTAPEGDFTR